jgi:ParB family chromosome partitioning protein
MLEDRKTEVYVVPEASKPSEQLKLAALSLDRVVADENNVRSKLGDLDELMASIKACGVISPIRVRPIGSGLYKIVYGHRRFAAAKRAEFETIPCLIGDEDDPQAEINQLVENTHRLDVPAIDMANAIARSTLDDKSLAEKMAKSPTWIRSHRALLKLDKQIVKTIKNNALSLSQAQEVKKVMDDRGLPAAVECARAMHAGSMSIREARRQNAAATARQRKTFHRESDGNRFVVTIETESGILKDRESSVDRLFDYLAKKFEKAA